MPRSVDAGGAHRRAKSAFDSCSMLCSVIVLAKRHGTPELPPLPLRILPEVGKAREPLAAGGRLRNPEKIPACYLIIIYVLNGVGKDPVGLARENNYPGAKKRSRRISETHVLSGAEKIPLARIGKTIIPAPKRSSHGPLGAQDVLTYNWNGCREWLVQFYRDTRALVWWPCLSTHAHGVQHESQKTFGTAMSVSQPLACIW